MKVAAFYKFARLSDCAAMRAPLLRRCREAGTLGTILLAPEGVNGTISGSAEGVDAVVAYLRSDPRLSDLETKEGDARERPFYRMKVRLKKEIVTLRQPEADPARAVGRYVDPKDWNALIQDPDVVVIDARNAYETALGGFVGAVDPKTDSFCELPAFLEARLDPEKDAKVAMYCTGGIRCEKSTAYLLQKGFKEVFHLRGGILKYLEETPEAESLWTGECFVFDQRVTVNHALARGAYDLCRACRRPVSADDKRSELYEEGVACPACFDCVSGEKRARLRERHKQVKLVAERGQDHLGQVFEGR